MNNMIEVDFKKPAAALQMEADQKLIEARKVTELRDFLKSLGSGGSRESYQLRRGVVDNYSAEEVRRMILDSTQLDWVKKPIFYKVLLDKYIRLFRSLTPEQKSQREQLRARMGFLTPS